MEAHIIISHLSGMDPWIRLLKEKYRDHRQIAPGVWAVKSDDTCKEIAEAIFGDSAETKYYLIVRADSWYGSQDSDLWAWLDPTSEPRLRASA